jgi:hypothetical protein
MSPTLPKITLKRGATLALGGTATLPAGVWTAKADLCRAAGGTLVEHLDVTLTAPTAAGAPWGLYVGCAALKTAAWPVGEMVVDIRFADDAGNVIATPSFALTVEHRVTNG